MALKKRILPVLTVNEPVVFPEMQVHFDISRKSSIEAVNKAFEGDGMLFISVQTNSSEETLTESNIEKFGTIVKILKSVNAPEGNMRILVGGVSRGKISSEIQNAELCEATVTFLNSSYRGFDDAIKEAAINCLNDLIVGFSEINPKFSVFDTNRILKEFDASFLADTLAVNLIRNGKKKQEILAITNVKNRYIKLIEYLTHELDIMKIEGQIITRVKKQIDDSNRDYYLHEQIKALHSELGDDIQNEIEELYEKAESLNAPDEVHEKLKKELKSLEHCPPVSPESTVSRHYIETILDIPWNIYSELNYDIQKSTDILERDHCGLEDVKKRVLEQLAVINRTGVPSGSIICLLGAPGVGKTSIARSIAEASGRKFARVSLGGMHDEAELRGHRKTYVSAMPGRIVSALIQAGTSNPLILLDEIDKLSSDYKGDPASALLEILDSEQNVSFRDNFTEVGIDLSGVLFIATANSVENIPSPLLDRLEFINLPGYTTYEKADIAKKHLIPKQYSKHGLSENDLTFTDKAIYKIITDYTREAGVRKLEQHIAAICRKAVFEFETSGAFSKTVDETDIKKYLGIEKYSDDSISESEIGLANGLAWTEAGGEVLQCEAAVFDGTGVLKLTGKLGEVMQESAGTAVSYIRSISDTLGIDKDFYKNKDIHIHFPEGAVPKDGPSAGICIATALISALTKKPVRNDIAMTGEISLLGRVLPIGGLKEKSLGAYRLGIKKIIIPQKNMRDTEEFPDIIKSNITFYPVKTYKEVYDMAIIN